MEIKVIKGFKTIDVYRSDIIPKAGERIGRSGGQSSVIDDVVHVYSPITHILLHIELWLK